MTMKQEDYRKLKFHALQLALHVRELRDRNKRLTLKVQKLETQLAKSKSDNPGLLKKIGKWFSK